MKLLRGLKQKGVLGPLIIVMSVNLKAIKISLVCSLGLGLVFALFSLVFSFGDWHRLFLVFFLGAFIGLVGAPEIEPEAFKKAWLFQLISGVVSGGLVGLLLGLSSVNILAAVVVGGILGWSAPFWAKHVPIP